MQAIALRNETMSHNWDWMHLVLRDTRAVLERSVAENRARQSEVLSLAMGLSQLRKEIQEIEKEIGEASLDVQERRPSDETEEGQAYFAGV